MGCTYYPNDKVKFRSEYDGYFKNLKGQELTVKKYYPREGDDGPWVTLKEIKERHLIKSHNVRRVLK